MTRESIPSWYFALVVVRHEAEFLLVQEARRGSLWYLPAGRVEPGETLEHAAIREAREETGVAVALDGVLRIEHTPLRLGPSPGTRVRVFFSAYPTGDRTPKTTPDEHSLGAAWVTLPELSRLPLRGPEVAGVINYVAHGGTVYPLDLITYEGASWSA